MFKSMDNLLINHSLGQLQIQNSKQKIFQTYGKIQIGLDQLIDLGRYKTDVQIEKRKSKIMDGERLKQVDTLLNLF